MRNVNKMKKSEDGQKIWNKKSFEYWNCRYKNKSEENEFEI